MSRKKRKRNKNPLLLKKWDEGYDAGVREGIARSVSFFAEKFKGLEEVPGIGEKTMKRIKTHLGSKYFE